MDAFRDDVLFLGGGEGTTNFLSRLCLSWMGFDIKKSLEEVVFVALECDGVHGGDATGKICKVVSPVKGKAGNGIHHCCSVHNGDSLLGTEPIQRLAQLLYDLCCRTDLTLVQYITLSNQGAADIG